jgi:hypothetical protein
MSCTALPWLANSEGLRDRTEDIEPNIHYVLEQHAQATGVRVTFSKEARDKFLAFAVAPESIWAGNFRDLSAALARMATLAPGGRISTEIVDEEIDRLRQSWHGCGNTDTSAGEAILAEVFTPSQLAGIDRFDQVQLADVLCVCREAGTISEAGRILFAASRKRKSAINDADRLRKYLARFGLDWQTVRTSQHTNGQWSYCCLFFFFSFFSILLPSASSPVSPPNACVSLTKDGSRGPACTSKTPCSRALAAFASGPSAPLPSGCFSQSSFATS